MAVAIQRPSVPAPLSHRGEDPRACCGPSPLVSPWCFSSGVFLSLLLCFDLLLGHSPLAMSIRNPPRGAHSHCVEFAGKTCITCRNTRSGDTGQGEQSQCGCSSQPCSWGESQLHYLCQHPLFMPGEGRDTWVRGRVFHTLLPDPARDGDLMTARKATCSAPSLYILIVKHPFYLPCSPP